MSRFRYDFGEKSVSTSDVSGNIRLTEGYEEIKALSQIDLVSPYLQKDVDTVSKAPMAVDEGRQGKSPCHYYGNSE